MKIKEELKNNFDQAELLQVKEENFKISLENWDLQDLEQNNLQKNSLRVINNGKLGSNTSFGDIKESYHGLLAGAEKSAEFGDEAIIDFSDKKCQAFKAEEKNNYQQVSAAEMLDFIEELKQHMEDIASDLTLFINLEKEYLEQDIYTTSQGELADNKTNFSLSVFAPIPGGGSGLGRAFIQPEFFSELPEEELELFARDHKKSREVSCPRTGKYPVIFTPRALYFFSVSLVEGISGANIYQETSPLIDRLGEKIFSDKLSVLENPLMEEANGRRKFDDEGIPTQKQLIIDEGKLNSYIYDLEHAAKLDKTSTGNGVKRTLFGSGIDTPVRPALINPVIKPGTSSRQQMIENLEEGIMVENIIGFHSSNYEQGHFSVQAQGFHVRKGELVGRLEDVMIAGNIYQDFKEGVEVGEKLYPGYFGYYPYLLVEDIQITGE